MKSDEFELSLRLPLRGAWISDGLQEHGMANVVVARRGSGGKVLFANFLVDTHCMGIKDLILDCEKEPRFQAVLDHVRVRLGIQAIPPTHAAKLLTGAIAYAEGIGFPPTAKALRALRLLHDVDPAACQIDYIFGCEGMPRYESGPKDSIERQREIIATLTRTCGTGNFKFVLNVSPEEFGSLHFGSPNSGLL